MSALKKKAFLKNASNLGLEPVAEDRPCSNPPESQPKTDSDPTKVAHDIIPLGEMDAIMSTENVAYLVFPVQELYTNSENGLAFKTYYAPPTTPEAPIYICHHGAGSSALSFLYLYKSLRRLGSDGNIPGMFTFDARGHGLHSEYPRSYTLSELTADLHFVVEEFFKKHNPSNSMCMVGHSLGGAVITNFVHEFPQTDRNIKGLVMIDIVEETAVQSLQSIRYFLEKRPKSFHSINQAVQWHLQSRLLRNEESARVSVPNLLFRKTDGTYTWRAQIGDMAHSWDTWFDELSSRFLSCNFESSKLSKLLILSSNETLDKKLTIGQMQGKFQLVVFNNSTNAGHFLHEDIPHQVATSLTDFMRRYSTYSSRNQTKTIPSWGGKINP